MHIFKESTALFVHNSLYQRPARCIVCNIIHALTHKWQNMQ